MVAVTGGVGQQPCHPMGTTIRHSGFSGNSLLEGSAHFLLEPLLPETGAAR